MGVVIRDVVELGERFLGKWLGWEQQKRKEKEKERINKLKKIFEFNKVPFPKKKKEEEFQLAVFNTTHIQNSSELKNHPYDNYKSQAFRKTVSHIPQVSNTNLGSQTIVSDINNHKENLNPINLANNQTEKEDGKIRKSSSHQNSSINFIKPSQSLDSLKNGNGKNVFNNSNNFDNKPVHNFSTFKLSNSPIKSPENRRKTHLNETNQSKKPKLDIPGMKKSSSIEEEELPTIQEFDANTYENQKNDLKKDDECKITSINLNSIQSINSTNSDKIKTPLPKKEKLVTDKKMKNIDKLGVKTLSAKEIKRYIDSKVSLRVKEEIKQLSRENNKQVDRDSELCKEETEKSIKKDKNLSKIDRSKSKKSNSDDVKEVEDEVESTYKDPYSSFFLNNRSINQKWMQKQKYSLHSSAEDKKSDRGSFEIIVPGIESDCNSNISKKDNVASKLVLTGRKFSHKRFRIYN